MKHVRPLCAWGDGDMVPDCDIGTLHVHATESNATSHPGVESPMVHRWQKG